MKITNKQVRQIIKEELENVLSEATHGGGTFASSMRAINKKNQKPTRTNREQYEFELDLQDKKLEDYLKKNPKLKRRMDFLLKDIEKEIVKAAGLNPGYRNLSDEEFEKILKMLNFSKKNVYTYSYKESKAVVDQWRGSIGPKDLNKVKKMLNPSLMQKVGGFFGFEQ